MTTKSSQPGPLNATSRKVFSREGVGPSSPIYINNVEFSGMGMDIFMDVGTVDPESVQAAVQASTTTPSEPPVVDFNIRNRFAMTLQTVVQMHAKLTDLVNAHKASIEGISKGRLETKG